MVALKPDICFDCGARADHQHHVVPRSKGGVATVSLCEACHGKVHDRRFLNHSELTRRGLARARARGMRTGGIPYGFRLAGDGKSLVVDQRESDIVRRARCLRRDGLSLRAIGRRLVSLGYTPRRAKKWHVTVIARMVADSRRSSY